MICEICQLFVFLVLCQLSFLFLRFLCWESGHEVDDQLSCWSTFMELFIQICPLASFILTERDVASAQMHCLAHLGTPNSYTTLSRLLCFIIASYSTFKSIKCCAVGKIIIQSLILRLCTKHNNNHSRVIYISSPP